jgi:hypothetical protein
MSKNVDIGGDISINHEIAREAGQCGGEILT